MKLKGVNPNSTEVKLGITGTSSQETNGKTEESAGTDLVIWYCKKLLNNLHRWWVMAVSFAVLHRPQMELWLLGNSNLECSLALWVLRLRHDLCAHRCLATISICRAIQQQRRGPEGAGRPRCRKVIGRDAMRSTMSWWFPWYLALKKQAWSKQMGDQCFF